MSQALYRKYRPTKFKDVTGQKHVVQTVQNQIKDSAVSHAYLFSGPRGIGKTTIARLLAKTVNCEDRKQDISEPCEKCKHCKAFLENSALDIIEIDAASHTGVDNVRENIIEAVRFSPTTGKNKVFIIDEVHMLSASAFNALLKTLEEPPEYAVFILATTEVHKIPQTILSRCQRFNFHKITSDEIVDRLKMILKAEGVEFDQDVLERIAKLSEGCLRDSESLLNQIMALGEKHITSDIADLVLPQTNTKTVIDILNACEKGNSKFAINELNSFVEQGGSVKHLIDDLIEESRHRMLHVLRNPEQKQGSFEIAHSDYIDKFLKARSIMSPDSFPQLPLELAILDIVDSDSRDSSSSSAGLRITDEKDAEKSAPPVVILTPSEVEGEGSQNANQEISISDIKSKWKRVCEHVAKSNIALPLVLQSAKPLEIKDGNLRLGFEYEFHFDTISQSKNLELLTAAIKDVLQIKLDIVLELVENQEEKKLGDLANAFGGSVVD